MELNDTMSPKISKSVIFWIVWLRTKENYSDKRIAQEVKLPTHIISEILEKELENLYSEYSTLKTYVSTDDEKEIVRLRSKDKCSKSKIYQKTRLSKAIISAILNDKLKETRSEYSTIHTYVSNEDVREIVQLLKEEFSLNKISVKMKIPLKIIKTILRSEYIIPRFENIYNKVVSDIQTRKAVISMVECYSFYLEIHGQFNNNAKYKDPIKLTPIAIYFYLRSNNVIVTTTEFIRAANLTREEFRNGFKTVFPHCKNPWPIDHKVIIYSLIAKIQEEFKLPNYFNNLTRVILDKYGHYLMHTKPEITAGVVCILSLLKLRIKSVTMSTICRSLGFQMSAALYQVKNNILKRMGIKGFQGFKKTAHLIEPLLESIPLQVY